MEQDSRTTCVFTIIIQTVNNALLLISVLGPSNFLTARYRQ